MTCRNPHVQFLTHSKCHSLTNSFTADDNEKKNVDVK